MTSALDQKKLQNLLINRSYSFTDSPFEPSSDKPINEDELKYEKLAGYLKDTYQTCEKPWIHLEKIEKILGSHRAQNLIKLNKSEYFKVLTHFAILSKIKRGWFNLFVTSPIRTSKPSLSDNPSRFAVKNSKNLNDAIVRCFYSRLFEGMTEQEKEHYQILLPTEFLPTRFDKLLLELDQIIQDLFRIAHQKSADFHDDELLPDRGLDEAIEKTRQIAHIFFDQDEKEEYSADTLRATLIKFATLNRSINDIDAILNIYNELINCLPNDIQPLKYIETESEILPALLDIFNLQPADLPHDLIRCAKVVCKMYIIAGVPHKNSAETLSEETLDEFNKIHMQPYCIAVSAALLCHDFLQNKKLNLHTRGETNKYIPIYKTLSIFSKKITSLDTLSGEIMWNYGVPDDLFKFLTGRYSISVFGLSDFYPSQKGAAAYARVKIKKFELQREIYELLKDMSIKEACVRISNFYCCINDVIKTAP
jgi:hypothetical protein